MKRVGPALRLSLSLACLCVCTVLVAADLDVLPNRSSIILPSNSFAFFFVFLVAGVWGLHDLNTRLGQGQPTYRPVPTDVRIAIDALSEGVLVLDHEQRVMHANSAFAEIMGEKAAELHGKSFDELPWLPVELEHAEPIDWESGRTEGEIQLPIVGEDDLTTLELKNAQLRKVLERLRQSRSVVRRQNQDLKNQATRDPLTGCFNRRTMFAELDSFWSGGQRFHHPFSCVMLDVDHFKAINDQYGHAVGDEVLRQLAETLRITARKSDVVCRYGGEEFCILLPQVDIEEAHLAAERLRVAIADNPVGPVRVTISLGVSANSLGAKHPQELLDQADKALFTAKRGGRNRAHRYDRMPVDVGDSRHGAPRDVKETATHEEASIPFHAVTALLSALGYRHAETAEHSRRVADLCVAASNGLMSQKQSYTLEVAALLHDIGKLGVPDALLNKPGPLTPEEFRVLRTHQEIGLEIIQAAFTCDELNAILRARHIWFADTNDLSATPRGHHIPLGARVLAIADAYDSMTSDRVYRKGIEPEKAFAELRRCSGTQFDPVLVDRFIQAVKDMDGDLNAKPLAISKQTALRIGMQIEKLAIAADVQDAQTIAAMASQLRATASEHGIASIAELAGQLEREAVTKANRMNLMELTIELLDRCRATQRTFLPSSQADLSVLREGIQAQG